LRICDGFVLRITIATAPDDGISFIGYVAARYMEAHGRSTLLPSSRGAAVISLISGPKQALAHYGGGATSDAVLQEAIMTPWWQNDDAKKRGAIALPAGDRLRLEKLGIDCGFQKLFTYPPVSFPAVKKHCRRSTFSDFCGSGAQWNMATDVAYLITWWLGRKHGKAIERQ